jgi:pilus assembly protein CpaB
LRSRLLIIVLAAVLALAGTVAVLAYARNANQRAIAGLKTVNFIAARDTIRPRTSLAQAQREGLLTSEKLPASSVPPEALQSAAGLGGLVFSSTVQPAQLVLRPMLVPASQSTAASVLPLPPNMVAVTLQMCVPEAIAGYLTAGSDVEVYATVPANPRVNMQRGCTPNHQALPPFASTTTLLLPKVLVLSVQQATTAGQSASSGSSVVTDPVNSATSALTSGTEAVTFAVTSGAEAEKLIEVAQVDMPYLALLPPTSH